MKYVEVDAFGIPLRTISNEDGIDGEKLKLTIDIELQKFVLERLKKQVASVVVMDVKSGEIISLNSNPSFNPNNFVEGVSLEYWQALLADHKKPLNNKPISAIYPPGSIFKLVAALAALEHGIDPKEKIKCTGKHRLGKRVFHCWKKTGHGKMNMVDAIANSCNVYFFNIANQIGIDKITEMARRFGYGEAFDIDLAGAKEGNLPTKSWKEKIFKQSWVGGDTLNSIIGQGFILATPLQIAVATARIANGGVAINPYLVQKEENENQFQKLSEKPLVKKEYLDIVRQGMYNVVNSRSGSAYYRRITQKGFEMAGKTGTAQVISKRENEMSEEEFDENKNHALFTAYAPAHNPKYAISVVVEHGGGGSAVAAPIARDILLEVQRLNKS